MEPPAVKFVGRVDHADFREVSALLQATASRGEQAGVPPEVIVVAEPRPNQFPEREVQVLQQRFPLAGLVALLGSWCEGETRTGRPWPGMRRLYWYEFPCWWRRQLALRRAGLCPEWLRPPTDVYRSPPAGILPAASSNRPAPQPLCGLYRRCARAGVIVLSTHHSSTAEMVADLLSRAGYAMVWQQPARVPPIVRGAVAGIWDGGQLDERESSDLTAFCRALSCDAAPVVALLDFPRRDRCDEAVRLGASAVMGKPLINAELIETIEHASCRQSEAAGRRKQAA